MKLLLTSLIVFTISCTNIGHYENIRFFSYEDTYNWKDCVSPSMEYIEKELPMIKIHFNDFIKHSSNFKESIHFIDLNNDKKLDVIYSGTSGAEIEYVVILLKRDTEYKVLFEEYTDLRELVFENNVLVSYTILDLGCCADYVQKEIKYKVNSNWKKEVVYCRAKTSYTIAPKHFYEEPIKFKTINETYKLRSSPCVNDTSMFIYDTISNVVSTYEKGAVGYAWAEEKDSTGRVWWFVEMVPNKNQINSRINTTSDKTLTRNLGWMSSNFLEKLK